MQTILIYGGTFDPPHYGHLNTAKAIQKHVHFDRFIFLPCKIPVLKANALASSEQRIHMLKLALEHDSEFEIDDREIVRSTPSFMVETLENFRQELGTQVAITLCIGMDSFMQLPQWKSWEKLLTLSHLLVIERADNPIDYGTDKPLPILPNLPETMRKLLLTHESLDKNTLLTKAYGSIVRFDAGYYPISSSWLRSQLQSGHNIEAYLPANVYQYIKEQALYL